MRYFATFLNWTIFHYFFNKKHFVSKQFYCKFCVKLHSSREIDFYHLFYNIQRNKCCILLFFKNTVLDQAMQSKKPFLNLLKTLKNVFFLNVNEVMTKYKNWNLSKRLTNVSEYWTNNPKFRFRYSTQTSFCINFYSVSLILSSHMTNPKNQWFLGFKKG